MNRPALPTATASAAASQSFATNPEIETPAPNLAMQPAPQQRKLHPSGDSGRSRQSRDAPARIDPDPQRQRLRADVPQNGGQRDAQNGELQRRASIAQRVIRRRIQPAHGGRKQADRRSGQNAPHILRIGVREAAGLQQRARDQIAEREKRRGRRNDEKRDVAQAGIDAIRAAPLESPRRSRWRSTSPAVRPPIPTFRTNSPAARK